MGQPNIMRMNDLHFNTYCDMHKGTESETKMTKEQFLKSTESEGFFGLFLDELLIGSLNLRLFSDKEGNLQHIFISSEYRGKGYGNLLMEHACNWFGKQDGIRRINLYCLQTNEVALNLYKKHGFRITSEAWHFIVPLKSLKPQNEYTCGEISEDEIESAATKFGELFPSDLIRKHLLPPNLVFVLKDTTSDIVGICRFTPGFPGCFPFVLEHVIGLDDFLSGLKSYVDPKFDHIRITFFGNSELANLCKIREFTLHHEMFRLTRESTNQDIENT